MQVISSDCDSVTAVLSRNELLALSNALNEVCNGLDVPEFSTRMGFGFDEIAALLTQIRAIYHELGSE